MKNRLSVKEASELTGATEQYIRIGLQRGVLPFGYALKMNGSKYTYVIPVPLFEECTKIKVGKRK